MPVPIAARSWYPTHLATGSSARSDSFNTSMMTRVQEKDSEKEEKAPMVTVLAL